MKSIMRFGLLCAAIVIASFAAAQQKARYVMRLEGLTTGAPINIQSFSWGASNPVTIGGGSGLPVSHVSISSFNIMKAFDAYTPSMFLACAQGSHYPSARVQGFLGDATVPFMDLMLETVYVESIQHSGSAGGGVATESVSFAFAKAMLNGVVIQEPNVASTGNLDQLIAILMNKTTKARAKVTVN